MSVEATKQTTVQTAPIAVKAPNAAPAEVKKADAMPPVVAAKSAPAPEQGKKLDVVA